MIEHTVRTLPPSVTGSGCCRAITGCGMHMASWCGGCLLVVAHAFQVATTVGGPHISFKTVMCFSYTCPSQQVGLQHLRDEYPPHGCPSDFLFLGRKQDTREKNFVPRSKRQKWGQVNHASGLTCNLNTLSVFLRDQFHLFRFFTCLHKTTFPFSFV
jgi:hypothetical protein